MKKSTNGRTKRKSTNGHGGRRPGSGRKSARMLELMTCEESLIQAFKDAAAHVPTALEDLIKGVYIMEQTPKGQIRIYQKPPNVQAVQMLADRVLGKVPTTVKHGGDPDNREPIPLVLIRPARTDAQS